jgi:hypothetical protein
MESECAEILARAIGLPKESRAALADSLLDTLDTEVDENGGKAVDRIPAPALKFA